MKSNCQLVFFSSFEVLIVFDSFAGEKAVKRSRKYA